MDKFSVALAFEREDCDHYILIHPNMTYNDSLIGMEKRSTATIVSQTFYTDVLMSSQCVHITSCAPPESKTHMDLMNAVKTKKSLSWEVWTCQQQPVITNSPDQEKETGTVQYTVDK